MRPVVFSQITQSGYNQKFLCVAPTQHSQLLLIITESVEIKKCEMVRIHPPSRLGRVFNRPLKGKASNRKHARSSDVTLVALYRRPYHFTVRVGIASVYCSLKLQCELTPGFTRVSQWKRFCWERADKPNGETFFDAISPSSIDREKYLDLRLTLEASACVTTRHVRIRSS